MRFRPTTLGEIDGRLLKNIGWLGSANVLVKPIWFVFITAFCMRLLGVDGYGVFSAALALATVIAAFSDFGTTRFLVREIARDRESAGRVYTNVLAARIGLIAGAFLLVLATGLILGYRGQMLSALFFASIYAFALSLVTFYRGVFQGFEVLQHEARSLYVEKGLVIGFGLLLLYLTRDAHWTLAGMAAGMVFTLAYCFRTIDRKVVHFRREELDRRFILRHGGSIFTLGLASIFALLYLKVDMVMIERMIGERAAGHYGAAYRILEALNMLPQVVAVAAIYPRLSSLHGEVGRLVSLVRSSTLLLTSAAIAISILLTVGAAFLINLLAPGGDFLASGPALQVLAWTFPFVCANAIIYAALIALRQERYAVLVLIGAFVFNASANWMLIPNYGIIGSAAATVVTEILLLIAYAVRLPLVLRKWRGADNPESYSTQQHADT